MKRKWIALLLSALVLPGLGQLYLGRKVKGIALLLIVNLLMLLALFVLLKGLSPVIAAKIAAGTVVGADEVLAAVQGVSTFGRALLAAFGVVWGYGVVDILTYRDEP
jgi:TM2 domain-containing membrane protein YozV